MKLREDTSARLRFSVVPLAVVLALLLTSCPGPEYFDDCRCPNLEATVLSIDWMGDGTTPDRVEPGIGRTDFPLRAMAFFNTTDRVAVQQLLADRMAQAGFTWVADRQFSDTFHNDNRWWVHVQTSGSDEEPQVAIFVDIVDDDERAAEILAPLAAELGILP